MDMVQDIKIFKFGKDSVLCKNRFHWRPATGIRMRLQYSRSISTWDRGSGPQVFLKIKQN